MPRPDADGLHSEILSSNLEAVVIFRNWERAVQICLDIVHYGSQTRSAFRSGLSRQNVEAENPVELVFCNPDVIWRGGYHQPRLKQGEFREVSYRYTGYAFIRGPIPFG
jgi:ribonucleotide monophosphatase NagD (HAD superfamily)